MKVTGIIAEFNPIHNGHKALIDYARNKLKSDYVIIAMSGNFTQRGTPAICNKYTRAQMALWAGADMVIEIPTPCATSAAQYFARGGVGILHNTGVCSGLLFGAEADKITDFHTATRYLLQEDPEFKAKLQDLQKRGANYPTAFKNALLSMEGGENIVSLMMEPNNTLGIEYLKALEYFKAFMKPYVMKRVGAVHDQASPQEGSASASYLRKLIKELAAKDAPLDPLYEYMPRECVEIFRPIYEDHQLVYTDDMSSMLHQKLVKYFDFSPVLDIGIDLSNRMNAYKKDFTTYSDFVKLLKTKNITQARIRRGLLHLVLEIVEDDQHLMEPENYAPYLHILGFRPDAKPLLKEMKKRAMVPIFIHPQELKSVTAVAGNTFHIDRFADDTYRVLATQRCGHPLPTEYTRQFEPMPPLPCEENDYSWETPPAAPALDDFLEDDEADTANESFNDNDS